MPNTQGIFAGGLFEGAIKALQLNQSIKEQKQREQAFAIENALKSEANHLAELRLDMDISRASGGEFTGVKDYETGLTSYADYVKNAPKRATTTDVLGGYPAPSPTPIDPSTSRPMTTFKSSAAMGGPIRPSGTGMVPRQESPQAYSQPGVSEDQIQKAIPNLVGANDEDIARYIRGNKNISTSIGSLLIDPTTGGTRQVYSPSPGKTAISSISKPAKGIGSGPKEDKEWLVLGDRINALRQSSRSAIGVAALNNMRADRMLSVIDNPNLTQQDQFNLVADLQGIFKGGVPDEVALKMGGYKTAKAVIANLITMITSNPAAINTPEIHKHLKTIAEEIKKVDSKVIRDNAGVYAVAFRGLAESDPQRFADMFNAAAITTQSPGDPGYTTDMIQPPSRNVPPVISTGTTSGSSMTKKGYDAFWQGK